MKQPSWRLIGLCALGAILLSLALALRAQTNIVTMYGCTTGTVSSLPCTTQPVAVNTSGQIVFANNYTAGSGTATYKAGGTLFWDNTNTANAGDTNYVKSATFSIPASTAVANGDQFEINALLTLASVFTSTKSYTCNVGFSTWTAAGGFTGGQVVVNSGTSSNGQSIWAHGVISRLTASTFGLIAANAFTGSTALQGTSYTTGSLTWTSPQNFACEVKDGTGNAAAITINEVRLDWHPYF